LLLQYTIITSEDALFKVVLMNNFDFDAWAKLARTSPDEFERQRCDIVESHIINSQNVRRLRGLQCSIDMERIRARTPMKACLRISTLMWDAFITLNNTMNTAMGKYCESSSALSHSAGGAKIIYFPAKHKPCK
jgi:hypothetical protein